MTEEELEFLGRIKDEYWHQFSDLVNKTLSLVPTDVQPHLEMMLQESSSVYGRRTKERDDG